MTQPTNTTTTTVADLLPRAAATFGAAPAIRYQVDGEWRDRSYTEINATVCELARGLIAVGAEHGDRIAILSVTRPEWTYADFAITRAGGVVVPIYPTNSPEECEWVLSDSEVSIIFCENAEQLAKLEPIKTRLPKLTTIVVFDPEGNNSDALTLEDLRQASSKVDAAELDRRVAATDPTSPYTIIYTSGTTGPPKGCILTHKNYRAMVNMGAEVNVLTPASVTYLFLPLAHSFALLAQLLSIELGGILAYCGGDPKQIIAELTVVKPDYLPSVPRIFEKIHTLAQAVADQSAEEKERMQRAIKVGVQVRDLQRQDKPIPAEMQAIFDQAEERLYKNVRALFGGKLLRAITGAAPISKAILEFFYACGIEVLEGYGLTETSTAATLVRPDEFRLGTVGRALPGVEIRISHDGEVLLRGDNIFAGYYNNPEATAEALADGWLHTGDLGELDDDGFLTITGRKKDIIITAGGKNITPVNLENDLKQSRWVSQAVMYGDRKPYPVALVTLDPDQIALFAQEHNLPSEIDKLADIPEVKQLVQTAIDTVNSRYAQVEQIKRFAILGHDLSQETGELTPTLKVKRSIVYKQYADVFEGLYT